MQRMINHFFNAYRSAFYRCFIHGELRLVLFLIGLASAMEQSVAGQIRADEGVVFFPTAAYLIDDGKLWQVPIHGWIFEPEQGDVLRDEAVRSLQRTLQLSAGDEENEILSARCRLFLVDNERDKIIRIRLGDDVHAMNRSDPDGHFVGTIQLSLDVAKRLADEGLFF